MPFRYSFDWKDQKDRKDRMARFRARRTKQWLRRVEAFSHTPAFLVLMFIALFTIVAIIQ
jgi:hypothetical protein